MTGTSRHSAAAAAGAPAVRSALSSANGSLPPLLSAQGRGAEGAKPKPAAQTRRLVTVDLPADLDAPRLCFALGRKSSEEFLRGFGVGVEGDVAQFPVDEGFLLCEDADGFGLAGEGFCVLDCDGHCDVFQVDGTFGGGDEDGVEGVG